jgi:hypothetical protein
MKFFHFIMHFYNMKIFKNLNLQEDLFNFKTKKEEESKY